MNFKEIIEAAIEETGGRPDSEAYWDWVWRRSAKLAICFYDFRQHGEHHIRCGFRTRGIHGRLFTISETDLLDPNWSPATLAKQIDDGIARIKGRK